MWWTEQDQGQKDKQGVAKMRSLLLEMVEVDPAQSREVEQDLS
jgi:hypothetical protein